MNILYVFNSAGTCTIRSTNFDEGRLQELLALLNAYSYAVSNELIEPSDARLVDGRVVKANDPVPESQQWELVRNLRNGRLADSDWTQMPDVSMSDSLRSMWTAYRQLLRDVTLQPDPFNIVWPEPPQNT